MTTFLTTYPMFFQTPRSSSFVSLERFDDVMMIMMAIIERMTTKMIDLIKIIM